MDVTDLSGANIRMKPAIGPITIPPVSQSSGVACIARQYEYPTASADDLDEEEKVEYIIVGTPPIADFIGSPLSGGNPISVQFENLTTEAQGSPTSYSWKRRRTGSGDSFAEFSTAKNPLTVFGK
jgi:PKD repeat protein